MQLARATQDTTGPDGTPLVGRGYEVRDEQGGVLAGDALDPRRFSEIAVVEVVTGREDEQALRNPAFGVGRAVQLRAGEDDSGRAAVLDEGGTLRAGWVSEDVAGPLLALLGRERDLATWVCWEWLGDRGRAGLRVAVSRPELAPRRLSPPAQGTSAQAASALGNPRTWAVIAAVLVVVAILFVSCS